jgi:deoxycytidylate deaminase
MSETTEQRTANTEPGGPELVIGLVGAIGTGLPELADQLQTALGEVQYRCERLRLSDLLQQLPGEPWSKLASSDPAARYPMYMDAGNVLRERLGNGAALAMLAIAEIRNRREAQTGDPNVGVPRTAFLLHSLKHPDEVGLLRKTYGSRFVLIGAYAPRAARVEKLEDRLHELGFDRFGSTDVRAEAEGLIARDEREVDSEFGQNVGKTFPLADVFVEPSRDPSGDQVTRFVRLLFGKPYITPRKDELAMLQARVAALRSAALGRQVGAVITTRSGDLVVTGTNEVPKALGGQYWEDDDDDQRDFRLGRETSYSYNREVVGELLIRLQRSGWLEPAKADLDAATLITKAFEDPQLALQDARIMDLLEYGRIMHAELAAIVEAARRGVSINQTTLYATTFPCHTCARHIVGAGIERVVYIEPYPKSLIGRLHRDSIVVDADARVHGKVRFEPFVGVAPRVFERLFAMEQRKGSDGSLIAWMPQQGPQPRLEPVDIDANLAIGREPEAIAPLDELFPEKPGRDPTG